MEICPKCGEKISEPTKKFLSYRLSLERYECPKCSTVITLKPVLLGIAKRRQQNYT